MSASSIQPIELPSFWAKGLLKDFAEVYSGVWGDDYENLANDAFEPARVFRVSDVKDDNSLAYTKAPVRAVKAVHAKRYGLNDGDIVVVKSSGSNSRVISGRCAYFSQPESGERYIPSNFTFGLRPDRAVVDPRFLFYWLRTDIIVSRIEDMAEGSTYPNLKKAEYEKLSVPCPPLPEQQRIAQVLSTVQEAIAQQERLIRTTTELKQALMHKLFTEGLRGEALKETEIGRVPESWEVVKVMEAGTVVTGSTPSTSREDFYGGDYNLISPGDLDVTKYVNTVQKKLTALGFDQCRKLPKGAVLVGCIGNVGKVGIVADDRSATNQQINSIIPNERFDGEFLYYAMDYNRKRLEALAGKVTIPLVNKSNFERFQIAVPPLNDQRLIAEALDAVDVRKAVAENKRNALQDLFRTLLHELMTGKVRVPLERSIATSAAN